jgi:hypothetical protein
MESAVPLRAVAEFFAAARGAFQSQLGLCWSLSRGAERDSRKGAKLRSSMLGSQPVHIANDGEVADLEWGQFIKPGWAFHRLAFP